MRNSILVFSTLFLSSCGFQYDHNAYIDASEINTLLKSAYGSVEFYENKNLTVLAPKDYTLNVLKKLAHKNKYEMSIEWDRKSTALTYKADQIYDIKVHPGNSAQEINSAFLSNVEIYSAITFADEKPSEAFKAQLKKAFEEEQKMHDPMKHIDATYVVNMRLSDVKAKFENFLRKLYPNGTFKTVTLNGKLYQVITVMRKSNNVVTATSYVYYAFKELPNGQTEIQMHTAQGNGTHLGGLVTIANKEKSQEVLNSIVQKLGL